ncbi:MAG: LD-carboxypeptidase [Bacteroidales bacterium]|nr:LD-carboxypeptidase [Bacteroidales bacterium]
MKIHNYRITRTVLLDLIVLSTIVLMLITPLLMHSQKSPDTIYPEPLRPGDKIAVLSPAGPIKETVVDSAVTVMRDLGYDVVVYPHTFGKFGHFSGTTDERYADLEAALTDPDVRAIVCSRGGYGVVHNLDRLGRLDLRSDPKWVVGFSDISALHALMASQGVASVHASMASHIGLGIDDPDNRALFDILEGKMPAYTWEGSPYNHPGHAEGKLLGGNLAVIADLMATPFDIIKPGTILFIEDVSEPIYKIERILIQLKLAGILPNLKGLIIGQFTDYKPDDNHETMEAMIAQTVAPYGYPIAFGAPVGHVDHNVPLVEGSWATLDVSKEKSTLTLER